VHQFFSQNYRATIGVDFALKVISWDPQTVIRLQVCLPPVLGIRRRRFWVPLLYSKSFKRRGNLHPPEEQNICARICTRLSRHKITIFNSNTRGHRYLTACT
jgi:hypothetical protein